MMKNKMRKISGLLALVTAFALACPLMSFAGETIEGKDGWYFYDSDGSVQDFQGTRLFSDYELQKIRNNLKNAEQKLAAEGIEFVIMLTPNKETIYPEYMPDSYGTHAAYTRIDQLYDYLKDDFRVVYPKDELLAAKAAYPQYYLYYKTDSHWNNLGAYVAARALGKELGYNYPDLGSLRIVTDYYWEGDQVPAAVSFDVPRDYTYGISGFGPYNGYVRDQDSYGNYYWYYTPGAPARTLTVYGDSYSMAMVPFMGQMFQNAYLHRFTEDPSIIEREQPSVVVYQVLERFLGQML